MSGPTMERVPASEILSKLTFSMCKQWPVGIIGSPHAVSNLKKLRPRPAEDSGEKFAWDWLPIWMDFRMSFTDGFELYFDRDAWRERCAEQNRADEASQE
jgi:hypothetical protein